MVTFKYSETQQKILQTALNLIAKNGFKAATTKEIARQAEINESTLFKNFQNKGSLFEAIKTNEVTALQQKIDMILGQEAPSIDAFVANAVEQMYLTFVEHQAYITIMLRELDNEELNIEAGNIFEYTTNAFSTRLQELNSTENVNYNTAMFMLVSTLMIMVVNQANNHVLTDDLKEPISISHISRFTNQIIKNLK